MSMKFTFSSLPCSNVAVITTTLQDTTTSIEPTTTVPATATYATTTKQPTTTEKAPWFFLRLWRFINHLLTYLLTYNSNRSNYHE